MACGVCSDILGFNIKFHSYNKETHQYTVSASEQQLHEFESYLPIFPFPLKYSLFKKNMFYLSFPIPVFIYSYTK